MPPSGLVTVSARSMKLCRFIDWQKLGQPAFSNAIMPKKWMPTGNFQLGVVFN